MLYSKSEGQTPDLDSSLIHRIRSSDESAFYELYGRYAVPLIRYTETLVHDPDIAEDIVQDVFISLWDRRVDWQPGSSVAAYVYRAVRYKALDLRRHQQVVGQVSDDLRRQQEGQSQLATPDETYLISEEQEKVHNAIESLPERRRAAFIMRVIQGAEYLEVAEALGVTERAARILVSRARETLKEILSEYVDGSTK